LEKAETFYIRAYKQTCYIGDRVARAESQTVKILSVKMRSKTLTLTGKKCHFESRATTFHLLALYISRHRRRLKGSALITARRTSVLLAVCNWLHSVATPTTN